MPLALTPEEYEAWGLETIRKGVPLKGGAPKSKGKVYWVRRVGENEYSVTIVDHRGKILSVDTWGHPGEPITKSILEKQFQKWGIQPPKGFWDIDIQP